MVDIDKLVRNNIKSLAPYSSARDEFAGKEGIFLDANENPHGEYNRYPDPYQNELKNAIAEVKNTPVKNLFQGNGSDEIIDLLFRIFCNPGKDKVLIFPPTYGMYKVSADINNIDLIKVPLLSDFQLDIDSIKKNISDPNLKMIFICSPNNPTGNSINEADISSILEQFNGIVIIDEAYIEFSSKESWASRINQYNNLVVLQTMSKAWGLAGARLGIAITTPGITGYLNKVKPPYNISTLNQEAAIKALRNKELFQKQKASILSEKVKMEAKLTAIDCVEQVYPSDANFLLVKLKDAHMIYQELLSKKLIVRNRNNVIDNCLRITIGTPEENESLIKELKNISDAKSTIYR